MPATGREFIQRALLEVGYLAAGEPLRSEDEQAAHLIAKRLVTSLGAMRLNIFDLRRTLATLTSGTRDYTIGPGGAIDVPRPIWIEMAGYIEDPSATDPLETPVEVLTDQRWADLRLKTFSGRPVTGIYNDRTMDANGRSTLSTYPTVDTTNTQLVLYLPRPTAAFDSVDTVYVLAPGYEEAFHYELAYQLQRPFGRPMDAELKEQRRQAWERVQKLNVSPKELRCDPAVRPGGETMRRSTFESGQF